MSIYDNPDALAVSLQRAGLECEVIEDGFIKLPIDDHNYIATIRVEYGWGVFKMFVGEWGNELPPSTLRSLLLINRRLLAFRFTAERGEIWVQEDFPLSILNDDFHIFVFHVIDVLNTVLPSLLSFFEKGIVMSDDDIDAVFDLIEATAAH